MGPVTASELRPGCAPECSLRAAGPGVGGFEVVWGRESGALSAAVGGDAFVSVPGSVWPPHVCTEVHAEVNKRVNAADMTADAPLLEPSAARGTLTNAQERRGTVANALVPGHRMCISLPVAQACGGRGGAVARTCRGRLAGLCDAHGTAVCANWRCAVRGSLILWFRPWSPRSRITRSSTLDA